MGSILDKFSSTNNLGNTAAPSGPVAKLKHITGMVIHPDGVVIPKTALATFAQTLAALQAGTLAAPAERMFPILTIQGTTNDTTAPEAKKAPYGSTVDYVENNHVFGYELEDLGIQWWANVRKFNSRTDLRVILFDPKAIHGCLDAEGNLQGFEADLNFLQIVPSTKTDYTKHNVKVELKDPEAFDSCHSIEIPAGTVMKTKLNGVTDVELSAAAASGGVLTVTAVKKLTRQDMYETYADELAKVAAWSVINAATGDVITPTGVTKNVAAKGWDIAYSQDGITALVSLVAPAALAALTPAVGTASAGGFESDTLPVLLEQ